MTGFRVLAGGTLTLIQDLGRQGCSHLGITPSGAMDKYAYRWSQKLLGEENGNALEILLSSLTLQATSPTTIAVCGADLDFQINGISKPIWQTHQIKKDDILSFKQKKSGMRSYLAVKGGFHTQRYEGSFSTTIREGKGKKLERGDTLPYASYKSTQITRIPNKYIPNYPTHYTLRIILSYQHSYFTNIQKEKFLSTMYTLTPKINRMGYKLQGEAMFPSKGDIISEGITYGAVQIPLDGQPIILLNERQTIGGYPKIGSVLPCDCFALAQLPIGATVNFIPISVVEAQYEMKKFYSLFY